MSAEQQAAGTVVGSEPSRAASGGAARAAVLPQHAGRQAGNVDASPAAPGMQGTKHSADEQEAVYQKRRQGDGTIYETNLLIHSCSRIVGVLALNHVIRLIGWLKRVTISLSYKLPPSGNNRVAGAGQC